MQYTQDAYPSVRPFRAHAIAATLAVVCLPVAVVYGLLTMTEPDPPLLAIAALGVLLALGATVAGTALWMRQPQSTFVGFSDLMVWRWMQRRHAERQLDEGAALLGLDRAGRPIATVRITPEQQLQVLKDLTSALESKDPYTHGHSQRVERHSYRTAAAMGLPAADIEDVRKAAALHDVGKIRVPDRILRKDGALSIDERAMIQEHSVVGAWMVSSVGNADVIAGVRHHHEAWDGSGYPDGLSGSDIPLFARIIAVADCYDAINSTRPYRASLGRMHAVDVLRAESGRQFDPEVVTYFLSALPTRLPVAAGLLFVFAGPARLLRSLVGWFRKFGAGSLTPAIGAAGAAVVLGASVFTPNIPGGQVERRVEVALTQGSAPVKVPGAKHKDKPAPTPERKGLRERRLVVALAPSDEVLGTRIDNGSASEQPPQPVADHRDPAPHGGGSKPEPASHPQPASNPSNPDPSPRPDPTSEPDPQPDPDPQPGYEPDQEPEPEPAGDDEDSDHQDDSGTDYEDQGDDHGHEDHGSNGQGDDDHGGGD
jgi:putative nucleotidyltransferase with HDIG domain